MNPQTHQFCNLDSIIEFINSLNKIQAPTDHEEMLINHIIGLLREQYFPFVEITPKLYLNVPPLLVGNPESRYIIVTHCDRKQENSSPLSVYNTSIRTVEGKLDNTVSLAVCLKLLLEMKPKNTSLLITTSEESKLFPQVEGLTNLQETGGRGFISFLEDYQKYLKDKYFICVDVRPLDRGRVRFKSTKRYMNLGDGLVLRTKEKRGNTVLINANQVLLNTIKACANRNNINLVEYEGSGITELGRGWERMLKPKDCLQDDYKIAWVQPPITHYHTKNEQMSYNDILSLSKIVQCLIATFDI